MKNIKVIIIVIIIMSTHERTFHSGMKPEPEPEAKADAYTIQQQLPDNIWDFVTDQTSDITKPYIIPKLEALPFKKQKIQIIHQLFLSNKYNHDELDNIAGMLNRKSTAIAKDQNCLLYKRVLQSNICKEFNKWLLDNNKIIL